MHTFEFSDHYVIAPSTEPSTNHRIEDFSQNAIGEKGELVKSEFAYSSDKNTLWLDEAGIKQMIKNTPKV